MPTTLAELAAVASACTACRLAEGRTRVVFGSGDEQADLMFVGEGPGAEEDKQGLPFVGRSGQLLDRLIQEELGRTRASCYIGNTTKCLGYRSRVQLGDGSWERVGILVSQRYDGMVRSVDGGGRLVNRRVIGWHSSPRAGRPMVRLSYATSKRAGVQVTGVRLTADHEVLTPVGWMPVGALPPGTFVATGTGLSAVAESALIGTVLGDAHLVATAAVLQIAHSMNQDSYVRFKASLLAELDPIVTEGVRSAAVGGPSYGVVLLRTRATRALRTFTAQVGRPKRVGEWVRGRLTPLALAVWFMDDGHLRVRTGGRRPRAEIATCSFGADDIDVLVAELGRLGVPAYALGGRIHFNVEGTRALSKVIAPYVPESMRYKLVDDIERSVAFDPALVSPGPIDVLWDEAVVTPVQPTRNDQRLYCLDVEETHNFVTSGGVVHNCRPPGNRDPKPDEVEACWPYLDQQLDLIKPKVVITLGNFASKKLLDTDVGITKLRGQAYPFRDGHLVPTFHPAAALRGGGVVLAQMRSDFVRAKLLLEAAP